MRIAILADEVHQKVLASKLQSPQIELIFVDSLRSLCMVDAEHHFDGMFELDNSRIKQLQQLSNVWVNVVHEKTLAMGEQFIRYNGWNTLIDQPIWEIVAISEASQNAVKHLMSILDANYQIVPDLIGMITPRVIAMLVNEAYYTFEMGVSSKEEIDIAMKLGTNYPYGPFEWSERIGIHNIYELLNNLAKTDSRYTISKSLESAVIGKTFKWK